jgi:mRNA interferase RelE/StbE
MYRATVSVHLQKILLKLGKKDKQLYEQVLHKINEIIHAENLDHYKNLRYDMKDSKRVHVGAFVLVFQLDKKTNTVNFDDLDHHDTIYK